MRLEVGKKYVCRGRAGIKYVEVIGVVDGDKEVQVVRHYTNGHTDHRQYTANGYWLYAEKEHELDLVAEYKEFYPTPTTELSSAHELICSYINKLLDTYSASELKQFAFDRMYDEMVSELKGGCKCSK